MNFQEVPVVMSCGGEPMVGIVSRPEHPRAIGLVIVVGGPQYRIGSHRQFLLLARTLASAGYAVMRFDHRGMGDSSGDARDFESLDDDVAVALKALRQVCPEVAQVALWGLCDGASASLMYFGARNDVSLVGLCVLNPWVRSAATLARTQVKHYYGERLLQAEFWRKLFSGRFEWRRSFSGAWQSLARTLLPVARRDMGALSFQKKMADAWHRFPGKILLVLSGSDYTAKEFVECVSTDSDWAGALQHPGLTRVDLAQADHTFSRTEWRSAVEQATLTWMQSLEASV